MPFVTKNKQEHVWLFPVGIIQVGEDFFRPTEDLKRKACEESRGIEGDFNHVSTEGALHGHLIIADSS